MNNLSDILNSKKYQIKALSPKGYERVKAILEKEIEKITNRFKPKKGKKK
jgi:hypothetical protein